MTDQASDTWEGHSAADLAGLLRVSRVELYAVVDSTQDVAHALAEQGAVGGTVVVADAQRAGRGRQGRAWSSDPGRGVWCTIIERPHDARAVDVLSLRAGLYLAEALDPLAGETVRVKWPNDLMLRGGKVAGILAEARWSGSTPSWVAVGVGVNVATPDVAAAAGLPPGPGRAHVLAAIVGAVRAACAAPGWLTDDEVQRYARRDLLVGRRVLAPAEGTVLGIAPSGAIILRTAHGTEQYRAGTIPLAEDT